jgi:hypothetical protein
MSTSNPLQLHLLRRFSRWNINLLTMRSWKEVKGTNFSTPTLTSIVEGRFTSSIIRYIPLNPSKHSLHTNISNYNHVATLASDYGFGLVNTEQMGPEENTRKASSIVVRKSMEVFRRAVYLYKSPKMRNNNIM